MVRGEFPPAWLRQQYSVLQQRGSAAFQRVWGAAVPAGSRGLWTIKDSSRKTYERLHTMPWRTITLRYKAPLLVLGGALLAVILLMIIIKVPQWQAASWEGLMEPKDLAKLQNDARTTLVQALGGAVLLIGLYFTLRNLQLTQDRQITERYTRAVEQLGNDKLEVRLGAIYALERIARDSERDHWPIMEILTACVRENAPWKGEQPSQEVVLPKLATDIQAILTVLGRRTRIYRKGEEYPLNLTGTDLRGADLSRAHLEGALFIGAHLEKANLSGAHLEDAALREAHLEKATLLVADLNKAGLVNAHLEGAFVGGTNLKEATLVGTHLQGAQFVAANLEGADLAGAYLEGVRGLTIEQLSKVSSLYRADLDPPLLKQIEQEYPQLLEESQSPLCS